MVDNKKLKLLDNKKQLEDAAEYQQIGYKKGIPVEKGVILNEEYLIEHKEEIGNIKRERKGREQPCRFDLLIVAFFF